MQPLFKPQLKLVRSKAPNQAAQAETNQSTPATKAVQPQGKASQVQWEVLEAQVAEHLRAQCQHHLLLRTDL
jgi:hypothetical protein